MPRPPKYSREELLEKALEVFWEKGYEATTVHDLGTRMGIHPGSLFHTFGDKRTLFYEALSRYEEQMRGRLFSILELPLPKKEAIRLMFSGMIENLLRLREMGFRGCFMVNSLMELCASDPDMDRRSQVNLARLEEVLHAALQSAIEEGEISPRSDEDLRALSRSLMANVLALRMLIRVGAEPEVLHDVARIALVPLDAGMVARAGEAIQASS